MCRGRRRPEDRSRRERVLADRDSEVRYRASLGIRHRDRGRAEQRFTGRDRNARCDSSDYTRRFDRSDQVRAFLQIYQGTRRTEAIVPVSVRVRILDARGGATRDQSLVFSESDSRARRADCRINLPIDRLPVGEYLLEIAAAAGDEIAARKLRFTVR